MKNRSGKDAIEKKPPVSQAHLIALNTLFEAARYDQAGRDLAVASMKVKDLFKTDPPLAPTRPR